MTLKRPITGPIEPCTERQQNARDIDERSTVDASSLRQFDQFSRLDAEQTCDDEQFGDGAGSLVQVDHLEPSDYCCERRAGSTASHVLGILSVVRLAGWNRR